MQRAAWSLAANTWTHFCVDFACFYMLFAGFYPAAGSLAEVSAGFLLYNLIAFGCQPIIGYVCDAHRGVPVSLIGCLLLAASLVLMPFAWLALGLGALGNACFHIGGGIDSLINAKGKMSRSGIFVSSGVIGLALGTLAGKSGLIPVWLPLGLIILSFVLLAWISPYPNRCLLLPNRCQAPFQTASTRLPFGIVLLLCIVSITIRSYAGSVVPMPWRSTSLLILITAAAAGCGKAAGGLIADRLGARRTGVISLVIALPLLALGNNIPALCIAGIFLFNISMSITLCAIADKMPGNPGLAFGITTLALLGGNVPTFFFALQPAAAPLVITVLILISAACLYWAVVDQKGGEKHEDKFGEKTSYTL